MNETIKQTVWNIESIDDFDDWIEGQKVIAKETGFRFAYWDASTRKVEAFYSVKNKVNLDLSKGQKIVCCTEGEYE